MNKNSNKKIIRRNRINNKNKTRSNKRGSRGVNKGGQRIRAGLNTPDYLIVHLKYNELIVRAPAAIFDEYVFSMNGAFDPNVTGTGGQPLLWDQYSNMYLRYYIDYSKIDIELVNANATSGVYLTVFPTATSAGATSLVDAQSQDYARKVFVGNSASQPKARLRNAIHTNKVIGKPTLEEDNYAPLTSAQPTSQIYWVINAYAADLTTNLTYDMNIKITYRVRFHRRVVQDLSVTKLERQIQAYNMHVSEQINKKNNGPSYLRDKNIRKIVPRTHDFKYLTLKVGPSSNSMDFDRGIEEKLQEEKSASMDFDRVQFPLPF